MNKTAIFGSVALLLSIPSHLFTAESAERLAELKQLQSAGAGTEKKQHVTLGNTRFRLENLILPSIRELKDPAKHPAVDTALTLTKVAGTLLSAKAAITTALAAGPAAAGATVVNPAVGLAVSAGVGYFNRQNWKDYAHRPFSTPVLETWVHHPNRKYYINTACSPYRLFDWNGNETRVLPKPIRTIFGRAARCSNGGLEIEGIQTQECEPTRGVLDFCVRIECEDNPGSPDRGTPQLVLSKYCKCSGVCRMADCKCTVDFQTCRSPQGLKFETFTLHPNGTDIAIGFSNGTIGILGRTNGEDVSLRGWVSEYEKMLWANKYNQGVVDPTQRIPLHAHIAEHQRYLRKSSSLTTASNAGALAILPAAIKAFLGQS